MAGEHAQSPKSRMADLAGSAGDPGRKYLGGLPGKTYAKLLQELWTNVFPTASYWRHTTLVSHNRLAAFERDTSSYSFLPEGAGEITVTVTLLYRRAFIQLMDPKKWMVPDIVMARNVLVLKQEF